MAAILQGERSENTIFQQIRLVASVIPHFCVTFTAEFIIQPKITPRRDNMVLKCVGAQHI